MSDLPGEGKMKERLHAKFIIKNAYLWMMKFLSIVFSICITALSAYAVPETTAVRITDVTTSSFSVVWMTDVAADPSVEVYSDSSMQQRVSENVTITDMPAGSVKAAQAARSKGIMKVRVSGLLPTTAYYVRTVTKDPAKPDSISYSALQTVTTASAIDLYRVLNNVSQGISNDLVAFPVYVKPSETATEPRLGDLIILEPINAAYPISAFVGDGSLSPEGILDLNNLFGLDGVNLAVDGGDIFALRIYRAGNLSTLTHYRKALLTSGSVSIVGLLKGFFADINLDKKVDDQDFAMFKAQYRTAPDDAAYNPDFNFVDDPDGKVDVREFGKFAREYGRTDVN